MPAKNRKQTVLKPPSDDFVTGFKKHVQQNIKSQLGIKIKLSIEQLLHAAILVGDSRTLENLLKNYEFFKNKINDRINFNDLDLTPFEYAIKYNPPTGVSVKDCLKVLDKYGADASLINEECRNLHNAILEGKPDIAEYLINNCDKLNLDLNARGGEGLTAFMLCCIKSDLKTFKKLLSYEKIEIDLQDTNDLSALHYAAYYSDKPVMLKMLIDKGANWKLKDKAGLTFLHHFATSIKVNDPINKLKFKIIQNILEKNPEIDINVGDALGNTPLALGIESAEWVRFEVETLKASLDLNYTKFKGTALHLAVEQGNIEVIRILIEGRADINARNKDGATPVYLSLYEKAVKKPDIEVQKLLLEYRADPNIPTYKSFVTPLMAAIYHDNNEAAELLIQHQTTYINAVNILGASALMYAVDKKNNYIIDRILNHDGINLSLVSFHDLRNVLHHAIAVKNNEAVELILQHKKCTYEIIDALDIYGHSPLHMAVLQGNSAVVTSLTKAGADVNIKSDEGITPLQLAKIKGSADIVKILQDAGAEEVYDEEEYLREETELSEEPKIESPYAPEEEIPIEVELKKTEEPAFGKQRFKDWDAYHKERHEYYRKLKLSPSAIAPESLPKASWKIGDKIISSFDERVYETTDLEGNRIFIFDKAEVDNSKAAAYSRAIKKGIIKDHEFLRTTGVKLLYHQKGLKGFEVKINKYGDYRLFGNEIYSNKGERLFVLKDEYNHKDLKKLVTTSPDINIRGEELGGGYDEFEAGDFSGYLSHDAGYRTLPNFDDYKTDSIGVVEEEFIE